MTKQKCPLCASEVPLFRIAGADKDFCKHCIEDFERREQKHSNHIIKTNDKINMKSLKKLERKKLKEEKKYADVFVPKDDIIDVEDMPHRRVRKTFF